MRGLNNSKTPKRRSSSFVRYCLIILLAVLFCLWFVFNFYHINVTEAYYRDPYSSGLFGPQSHVEYQSLEAKQELMMKMDSLKSNIALLEKQIIQGHNGGGGRSFESDSDTTTGLGTFSVSSSTEIPGVPESELQNVIYRRNTRYWLETKHLWPKDPIPPTDKYITFSPWRGGFNNIRMSLEMAVAAAFAFNRTLVMPPVYKMYLRGKSALESYFDYESLRRGIPCITYEEFVERVPEFKKVRKQIPNDDKPRSTVEYFYEGLELIKDAAIHGKQFWGHEHRTGGEVLYCDPKCPTDHQQGLRGMNKFSKSKKKWFDNFKKGSRKFIDVGDPQIHGPKIIHFPANLLGHFYNFFWFENPQRTRQLKRLIRDHVHYKEEIFELAERIIKKLGDFKYSCLHIRRNEFQFKDVWTPADQIVKNIDGLIKPNEHVYIATDELSKGQGDDFKDFDPMSMTKRRAHTWFTPMLEAYGDSNVHFLDEYFDKLLASDVPSIWVGCVESIVCTRARVFIGTRKSTFSGYINRIRGYMHDVGQKMILDAQTKYPEEYYDAFIGPSWSKFPHNTFSGGHPYWGREYNEAWEGVWDPIS